MNLTLLLDLDDTLLGNDINTFLPVYSRALGKHIAPYVEPAFLIQNLMTATAYMMQNQRPDRTLQESFDEAFYPALKVDKSKLQGRINSFYREIFPTLKEVTQFRPEAVEMVRGALQRGYRISIATNPLFPLTAIQQRMAWAGLASEDYPFALVPSYETFHFVKPNPAFYAEYLARLGWPEGPVVMVGDSIENDILGARQLGLPAFWLKRDHVTAPSGELAPSASGKLEDLLPWLDSTPAEALTPDFSSAQTNTAQAILAILRSTPAALQSLVAGLPSSAWIQKPSPEEWCLAEIFCHLRDVESEVNIPRLEKMLQEANPFLPGMDTDPWAQARKYIDQDCMQALSAFTTARLRLLSILDNLPATDWERIARHAILGPTRLQEITNIIASHDRLHVQQVHQVLKAISNQLSALS